MYICLSIKLTLIELHSIVIHKSWENNEFVFRIFVQFIILVLHWPVGPARDAFIFWAGGPRLQILGRSNCKYHHRVANGLPPLQHFFKKSCHVARAHWCGYKSRKLVTRFGATQFYLILVLLYIAFQTVPKIFKILSRTATEQLFSSPTVTSKTIGVWWQCRRCARR